MQSNTQQMRPAKPATGKEVREFLGISEPTLLKLRKAKAIPFFKIRHIIRYDLQEVAEALKNHPK